MAERTYYERDRNRSTSGAGFGLTTGDAKVLESLWRIEDLLLDLFNEIKSENKARGL